MTVISTLKARVSPRFIHACRWLIPALSTILFLVIGTYGLRSYYGIPLTASGELTEFCAQLLIAYLLFAVSRRIWVFLLLQAAFLALLFIGNAVKMQFLQAPIMPADFSAISELFDVLSGWRFALALAPLILIPLLFIFNLRYSRRSVAIILVTALCAWLMLDVFAGALYRQMDAGYGFKRAMPAYNFERRGPALFLLAEIARKHADTPTIPDRQQVTTLLNDAGLGQRPPASAPAFTPDRDVYIILMETLWDPSLLKAGHLSQDPIAPAFRKLWNAGGPSWALTPTFGKGTANAEFEVLCGMPVAADYLVFVTTLVQDMPCLPRLLAQDGYQTIVSVPEPMSFFNVSVAYRHLGFERLYASKTFDPDDMNGAFLSDVSFFRQTDEHLSALAPRHPILDYLVTFSGHYPFGTKNKLRPPLISSDNLGPLPLAYANIVRYDTQETADYIAQIRQKDPDAVIVLFGDHLPALGTDSSAYVQSGLLPADETKMTAEQTRLHFRTPLLVINGRAGPVDLGDAPLYTLPNLILQLIGYQKPRIMQAFLPPTDSVIRPSLGYLLLLKDGKSYLCDAVAPDDKTCAAAKQWLNRTETLSTDLLVGKQYAATDLLGESYTPTLPIVPYAYLGDSYKAGCSLKVLRWGPQSTQVGQPFHPAAGGSSSFWFMFDEPPTHLKMWLGDSELHIAYHPGTTSATLYDVSLLSRPRTLPVTYDCNNSGKRTKAGDFQVLPAGLPSH